MKFDVLTWFYTDNLVLFLSFQNFENHTTFMMSSIANLIKKRKMSKHSIKKFRLKYKILYLDKVSFWKLNPRV